MNSYASAHIALVVVDDGDGGGGSNDKYPDT